MISGDGLSFGVGHKILGAGEGSFAVHLVLFTAHGAKGLCVLNLDYFVWTGAEVYQRAFAGFVQELLFISDGVRHGFGF